MSQATVRTRSQEGLVTYTRNGGKELESQFDKPVVVPAEDNKDPGFHAWAELALPRTSWLSMRSSLLC